MCGDGTKDSSDSKITKVVAVESEIDSGGSNLKVLGNGNGSKFGMW